MLSEIAKAAIEAAKSATKEAGESAKIPTEDGRVTTETAKLNDSLAEKLNPSPLEMNPIKPMDIDQQLENKLEVPEAKNEKTDASNLYDSVTPKEESLYESELQQNLEKYEKEVRGKSAGGELPYLKTGDWKEIPAEECKKLREEFNQIKEDLIKKWEEKNSQDWPRYAENVYSESGKLIRRAGDRYDAHHVHPLKAGGKNSAENITPMHAKDHYDKQGVHRPDGSYSKLSELTKENDSSK